MTCPGSDPTGVFYPVKLITGVLYPTNELWLWTKEALSCLWGVPEEESGPSLFSTITDYYSDIAPVLYRRFLSFKGLRDAADLRGWKIAACDVEYSSGPPRRVNIDPGYLNGARLVLASTKDHAHRIYIGGGIHAEVTLRYRSKRWVPFDYTFPDFADGRYDGFLSSVRRRWLEETAERRVHDN
ncbi:MAG: DUF4416 family protein [Aminobacteriaceae bacterium]